MMNFIKKKTVLVLLSVCAALLVAYGIFLGGLYLFFGFHKTLPEMSQLQYRTDTQPLIDRFGDVIDIESCYWKANVESAGNFGPSTYWMKGFILLSGESSESIKAHYDLAEIDMEFENGMTPEITGKSVFNWSYNEELSRKITGANFGGEVYFDLVNSILYVDLESM